MGVFERQREKTDARIKALAEPHLDRGEKIQTAFMALTRIKWLLALLPGFAIGLALELGGRGEVSSWVIGIYVGLMFVVVVRYHHVVLTDRRMLLLKLKPFSSKQVTDVWEVEKGGGLPAYREGWISGFVTLAAGGLRRDLQVPAAFRERARAAIARFTSG